MRDEVNGYPIQLAKVQRPALREETLERPRLLDWLRAKIHGRVVLVLADAGYGKTTLLADFSRRTRLRTLWYRLDDDDRDWVSFFHHLVAAGREHEPTFASSTAAMLADVNVAGVTRETVLDVFIRELRSLSDDGAVIVFDDFHLVDDAADVRLIVRELVARAPERVTIVFASRRTPPVPLARLRTVGEVAELATDDLRFDASETTRLFTETYGRRLDPAVLADLTVRTEGWIASLQLVQAALRDRSPAEIRRFVQGLSGADHELYDYLAEEVVGDLPEDLQRFLMETSILQVVTPELAEVVTGLESADVVRLTSAAERLTLLSQLSRGPRTHQRYHPLVREFLEARLRQLDGADAVAALHRRTAAAAAAWDWRIAAHHYREASDTEAMLGVVAAAIPTIMSNGQYALAEAFIGDIPPDRRGAGFDLILSRVDMQHGDYEAAIAASQSVLDASTDDPVQRDHALLNLLTLNLNYGDGDQAIAYATQLARGSSDLNLRMIAEASIVAVESAQSGDLEAVNQQYRAMASRQRTMHRHHFGVTTFNLATNYFVQDRLDDAITQVDLAIEALEETSGSIELASAIALKAVTAAQLGNWNDHHALIERLQGQFAHETDPDALIEILDAQDRFVGSVDGWPALDETARSSHAVPSFLGLSVMQRARQAARRRMVTQAKATLAHYPDSRPTFVASRTAFLFTSAYVAFVGEESDALALAQEALANATRQSAFSWGRLSELVISLHGDATELSSAVTRIGRTSPWHLTYLADLLVPRLEGLDDDASKAIRQASSLHPERWKAELRRWLREGRAEGRLKAAQFLEDVGDKADVALLRSVARTHRRSKAATSLGRALARRVADPVFVEDQGRVAILVGPRTVPGTEIRRKVLGLVCYLISRPEMSATRDQVLDALWPDLDPSVAINSLNQTTYFLRRVIEENYSDDLSPGYIHHDSDVIWFDPQLVTSRTVKCRTLIRAMPPKPSPEDVELLVGTYLGRFALDFEYEEWASAYRDTLHASFLEIVERSVIEDFTTGHYDRGINVARRILEIDPSAEQVEVCLLRMYRATGAHAAAAEQYAHYASVMREELGIEPPSLDAL